MDELITFVRFPVAPLEAVVHTIKCALRIESRGDWVALRLPVELPKELSEYERQWQSLAYHIQFGCAFAEAWRDKNIRYNNHILFVTVM